MNINKFKTSVEFYKMLSSIGNIRVKFLVFHNDQRPIRCKGRMISFESHERNVIEFKHLKYGSKYVYKMRLPIQNIRFIHNKSFDKLNEYIKNSYYLKKLFENHVEKHQRQQRQTTTLSKFTIGVEDSVNRCPVSETV